MSEWNAMTYEGKDTILRVVRSEAQRFFALASPPEAWERPTVSCPGWTTRDAAAHILDTTEGYFAAFDSARGGSAAPDAHGLPNMSRLVNERATALRTVPWPSIASRALMQRFIRTWSACTGSGRSTT